MCHVLFNIKEGYNTLWKFSANKTSCRFTWYYFFSSLLLSLKVDLVMLASIWF